MWELYSPFCMFSYSFHHQHWVSKTSKLSNLLSIVDLKEYKRDASHSNCLSQIKDLFFNDSLDGSIRESPRLRILYVPNDEQMELVDRLQGFQQNHGQEHVSSSKDWEFAGSFGNDPLFFWVRQPWKLSSRSYEDNWPLGNDFKV